VVLYPYFKDIHEDVRETARGAAEEFKKTAAEADEKADHSIVEKNLKRLEELGLQGLDIPEKYGGQGLDVTSCVITIEEVAKTCASTAISYIPNHLITHSLYHRGREEQKLKHIPPLCKDKIAAFALTEPVAGSDAAAIQTKAELKDNEYVINGTKHFCSNGVIADTFEVFATIDPAKRARGISTFIVDKDNPGLKMSKVENKMGMRASPTTEVFLDNCKVPREDLLSEEGEGFMIAMEVLGAGRVGIGAVAMGLSKAALNDAIAYAKERVQFGQPIAKFQSIQFMLADMATKIAAMENLTYHAAWLIDQGKRASTEAAMAKVFSSEATMDITNKAIQILGGVGYTKDYSVERYHRDAKVLDILEGSSEIQRIIISRAILR
jgi:butyryl-CoA dehydrogenase